MAGRAAGAGALGDTSGWDGPTTDRKGCDATLNAGTDDFEDDSSGYRTPPTSPLGLATGELLAMSDEPAPLSCCFWNRTHSPAASFRGGLGSIARILRATALYLST